MALAVALSAYYALAGALPSLPLEADVALFSLAVAPALLAFAYLALPFLNARGLAPVGLVLLVLAAGLQQLGLENAADFAKVGAMIAIGFWFLSFFERVSWVVIVALVVPLVDTASVARGPTNEIVRDHPAIFDILSVGFPVVGERTVIVRWDPPAAQPPEGYDVFRSGRERPLNGSTPLRAAARGIADGGRSTHEQYTYTVAAVRAGRRVPAPPITAPARGATAGPALPGSGAAPRNLRVESKGSSMRLGLPDFLFFALFLGAAVRWGLRPRATWVAMVASIGLTIVLALWLDPFGLGGLPALPGLSLGFLLANADRLRRRRGET